MLVCYTSNGRQWMLEVLWSFLMEKLIDQVIRGTIIGLRFVSVLLYLVNLFYRAL